MLICVNNKYIIRKGRMSQSAERNRFIASLVRMLAQKDQQLSHYRRQSAQLSTTDGKHLSTSISTSNPSAKEESLSAVLQASETHHLLADLQARLDNATEKLAEETATNSALKQKINDLETRERECVKKMEEMAVAMEEERKRRELAECQRERLAERVEQLKVEKQYQRLLQRKIEGLARQLLESQRFQQRIRQNIDAIISRYCQAEEKEETLPAKLARIEHTLEKLQRHRIFGFPSNGHILDETLDDMSTIMESFQEKLTQVACLSDREEPKGKWRQPLTCDGHSESTCREHKH